ncbi:phosphatase PAP2 family protein [uncultured Amphritea sp.]|uniref:phosphatase PAP2 family protein n=1 Tax=uncultured Amphritea sp. TaxID=981605 RepID=UPI00262E9440|nr:phosphatase PAP2 family protein [uncultured Amphritea sp.]
MRSLREQINNTFIVAGLSVQLKSSQQQFLARNDVAALKQLMLVAAGLLITALLLWITAGYHGAFHLLNQFTPAFPEAFWQIITFMGDTTLALTLALIIARRNPAILWVIFIAAIYGTLVTHGLKNLFGAGRPPVELVAGEYNLVGKAFRNGSFPSGHSLTAFVFVSIAYYFFTQPLLRRALLLLGGLVALSRVMVAAHWPVDILVGSAFGILVAVAAVKTAERLSFGFKPSMHLFIVFLLLVAALMIMSGHDGGYSEALLFGKLIAFSALMVFITEYFYPGRKSP